MILEIFSELILPFAAHKEGRFGESIDKRLGFQSATSPPLISGETRSWRLDPASYNSTSVLRLQELSTWRTSIKWPEGLEVAFNPDLVCVRLVDGVSDSPFIRTINGYSYIVLSTGHLHWVELVFRVQGALADLGKSVGKSRGKVITNYVGGADVERAIKQAWPRALALIATMLADDIFWQSVPGMPLLPPSELLARLTSFILHDGRIVPHPEEIPGARSALPVEPSTHSQKLAKLVCIYTVLHELEHVRLGHSSRDLAHELKCDCAATMLSPLFVRNVKAENAWNLAIGNNGTEYYAAQPAFFITELIRQLVALYIAKNQESVESALKHLRELGERRRLQAKFLCDCISGEPDLIDHVLQVDHEFMVMPLAVLSALEMLGNAGQGAFAEARHILSATLNCGIE